VEHSLTFAQGTYNTVQMLKLSGIGPKDELSSFKIPVKVDLPGVGTNMQDRYEVGLNVQHNKDFSILDGCTLDAKSQDKCYTQWKNNPNILAQRGTYATNGLAATMVAHSDYADNSNVDMFIFGSPANFRGYFPHWYDTVVAQHNWYSWYTLKAHTRNTAGTVKLRSADPLDVPQVDFNYFDTGTTANGAANKDLASLVQALKLSRKALSKYNDALVPSLLPGSRFVEKEPGPDVQSDEELRQFIKDTAWGHHAACTNAIGADGDKMAVLDSKFRVRGTKGLRVVDASVFPKIPGVFITAPIFVMAEKAADTILNGGS
jgi:choline dehydrogenase